MNKIKTYVQLMHVGKKGKKKRSWQSAKGSSPAPTRLFARCNRGAASSSQINAAFYYLPYLSVSDTFGAQAG